MLDRPDRAGAVRAWRAACDVRITCVFL